MPTYRFTGTIMKLRRHIRRKFESLVVEHDITATQFQVLRRLWNGDGMGAQNLAKQIEVDAATMTGVLDRLEAKNLVQRQRHETDRRAVRIFLTEEGRALEAPLMNVLDHLNEMALVGFNAAERDQFMDFLIRVDKNLSPPGGFCESEQAKWTNEGDEKTK